MYINEIKKRAIEIRNSPEYKEWRNAVDSLLVGLEYASKAGG